MSLSFQPITPVCVRDPRTMIEKMRTYAVLKSGSQCTWKQWTTTSISGSSLQFSCPPPSGGVLVDRKIYLFLPVRLSFTGTPPAGQTILQENRDAPRAFPVGSSIDTLTATINNQSVSINIADIIHALMHYNTCNDLKNSSYSMSPSYQDQSQNYIDLFGSIRSPLFNYGDANDGNQTPRGGFPFTIIANPVSDGVSVFTSIVDIAFCESIYLSPFYFGQKNGCGFYNVNTMDFNITMLAQAANRMWSHDDIGGTNVITNASFVFGGLTNGPASSSFPQNLGNQPAMFIQYITPQETQLIPTNMPITYPYFDVLRFPTDLAQSVNNTPTTYSSNNIQLSSIPRRLYLFIRERNSDLFSNPSHTDSFFQINSISIQFKNKNGLLASASMNQLYEMCVKNHCSMTWTQWSGGPVQKAGASYTTQIGTIGSVVCIEFASDIGLESLEAPGILSQSQLFVQVTATNVSGRTINPTLYLVPILEGTFTIQTLGQSSTNIGVLTPNDVLDCQQNEAVSYSDVENVNGGDFWSGLKEFGSKLWPYISKAHDFIKEHKLLSKGLKLIPHPVGQLLSTGAKVVGYGEDNGEGVMAGAHHRKHHMRGYGEGGVLLGGEGLSRHEMMSRLKHY
jgi:hypothetical protein